MFKLLKTLQTNKFLSKSVTRHFANVCDTTEYHFLDKLNYIGNRGVYWTHPQSSVIIRLTDDYNQCVQGNQYNDNTCWWYFPKRIRTMMENDYSEQDIRDIARELRNWKLIHNATENSTNFYAACSARCYGWFSQHLFEQKVLAAKHYTGTFFTDDVFEKLSSDRQFNSAASELLNNLRLVYSDKSDQVTDMGKFQGQNNIPDSYIEMAIAAIKMQREVMHLAKQLLKPKIYDLFVLGCFHYLTGIFAEKDLFQKHCSSKTFITKLEGAFVRHRAAAFIGTLPTMMTDDSTAIHLSHQNPAVNFAISNAIFENDIIGYVRDKFIEYCAMTFVNSSEHSALVAARNLADRSNEIKKVLVYMWENVPAEDAKHYEYLAKCVGLITDYSFVLGVRQTNYRYGWVPHLD